MNFGSDSNHGLLILGGAALICLYIVTSILQPGSIFSLFGLLIRLAFYGFIGVLLIGALIVFLILRKEKREKENPNPEDLDPNSEKRIEAVLNKHRSEGVLGPIARSCMAQKKQLAKQMESYRSIAARRFGEGSLTYNKYISLEATSAEGLHASFVKIVNRMDIFDDHEYRMFQSGQYKQDAVSDAVQEEKYARYEAMLQEMRDILEENEKILIGIDQLMVQMADSNQEENTVAQEVEDLLKQLEYYQQNSK